MKRKNVSVGQKYGQTQNWKMLKAKRTWPYIKRNDSSKTIGVDTIWNREHLDCTTKILLTINDNPRHLVSPSTTKQNIHGKKLLCILWDQLLLVYYELLKPSKTITGTFYRRQLMRSSRTLNKKRALGLTEM